MNEISRADAEFGSASIRSFSVEGDFVMLFVTGAFSAEHDMTGGHITVTLDQAADLFACLAEYLPLRRDEGEEAEVESILASAGLSETPD